VELALSPDGTKLAWVGNEGEHQRLVHICGTFSGQELHRLGEQKGRRRRIAFSPDGKKLVSTGDEGPGQIWDVQAGRVIAELPDWRKNWVTAAAFTPDSKGMVLTVGEDAMRLIDVATGGELWQERRKLSSTVLDVFAFAPNGKTLVVTAPEYGSVLHRYDTATGKRILSPVEPYASFSAVAFAPGEKTIYTLGADGMLRTWEVHTGKEQHQTSTGALGVFSPPTASFSPDGCLLAAQKERTTYLFDTATGKQLRPLAGEPPFAFSRDGHWFASTADKETTIVVSDVAIGKELGRLHGSPGRLQRIEFASNGSSLVAHVWDYPRGGSLLFWNLTTGRQRPNPSLPPHWGTIALSPDGKTAAVPLSNWKSIEFMEVASGQKRLDLEPPTEWPTAIGFSPDGSLFLVSQGDGSVKFYDAADGKLLLRREGHRGKVNDWAFSPGGRKLATISEDRTVLIWDMADLLRLQRRTPLTLSQAEMASLWSDLASNDAAKAYQAIDQLTRASGQTLPWLRNQMRPVLSADSQALEQLIADLDNSRSNVRQDAQRKIVRYGESARPAIEKALGGQLSAEKRSRLEQLAARFQSVQSQEEMRSLRAVEILERMRTREAEGLLEMLSRGLPEARLTREVKAALQRLAKMAG
jgi:WD40 repeat protein